MLVACSTKQTKTSRVIREINKFSTGHEHMGLQAGQAVSGSLERVSQCWRTKCACEKGRGGNCETRGANSKRTMQPLLIQFTISVMGTSLLFSFHYKTNLFTILSNNSGIIVCLFYVASEVVIYMEVSGSSLLLGPVVRKGRFFFVFSLHVFYFSF